MERLEFQEVCEVAPGSFGEMPGAATRWAGKELSCDRWEKVGKVRAPFVRGDVGYLDSLGHKIDRNRSGLPAPVVDVLLRSPKGECECSLASREGLGLDGALKGCLAHG